MLLSFILLAPQALAQEGSDLPEDIFTAPEDTIAEEKRSVLEGDTEPEAEIEKTRKPVIQTFQPKDFLKLGRYEVAATVGAVTNDPFLNRILLQATGTYHVTEVLAVEAVVGLAPGANTRCAEREDANCFDYKPITRQITTQNQVTPDISRIFGYANANIQFSPIYGKVAVGNGIVNFDIFGLFGTGAVYTVDDVLLAGTEDSTTARQWHPMVSFGGGARVIFSKSFAARVEGRGMSYIETLDGTTLEMKNNFAVLGGISLFFPGMK